MGLSSSRGVRVRTGQCGERRHAVPPNFAMGIFRWQHRQTGRLFNWGGAAAPALPRYIMAEWRVKMDADGPKQLARSASPHGPMWGTATCRPSQFRHGDFSMATSANREAF